MPRSGNQDGHRAGAQESSAGIASSVPEDGEARREISLLRVFGAVVLVAALVYGGVVGVRYKLSTAGAKGSSWFAPYVDATLTPTYPFQSASADPARQVVLGFVVSDPHAPCTPSWGAAYTMRQADQSLALATRVAELRRRGAGAIVSFGGKSHTALAVGCKSLSSLTSAYQAVIDHYQLHTVDFDVEGKALSDFGAERRRAAAVRALQVAARQRHQRLRVWLTLPVEPSGLQDNALSVIDSMLRARVEIAGVDVMAMDFSQPPKAGQSMLSLVERSLGAAHQQLATQLAHYGVHLRSPQVWERLGATVMIGQNNLKGERFTIADAKGLAGFAGRVGLGRVSMWSLNRDSQCGSTFAKAGILSNFCSGTPQSRLEFSHVFNRLSGVASRGAGASAALVRPPRADTNPANAPYPLWSPTTPYQTGYKVVRSGYIYQAKWYNAGQDPAAEVQYSYQTPWELLGPVLPSDHAPKIKTLAPGTYPAWSVSHRYAAGDRVLFHGLAYQAKWFNQGASPGSEAAAPSASPWKPLFSIPGEPSSP